MLVIRKISCRDSAADCGKKLFEWYLILQIKYEGNKDDSPLCTRHEPKNLDLKNIYHGNNEIVGLKFTSLFF